MLGTTGYDPGYPYDVYDSLDGLEPKEDYGKGYVIFIFATIKDAQAITIINFLKRTNPYAYIPTEYVLLDTGFPGAVCYAIYKTRFEYEYAKINIYKLGGKTITNILYEIPADKKVYFHKHWLLDSYDPSKNTDESKYRIASRSKRLRKAIGNKEFTRLRRVHAKTKPCYEPCSDKDDTCNMKKRRNSKICAVCGVSRYAGRYDANGKCIRKLTKEELENNRRKRYNKDA